MNNSPSKYRRGFTLVEFILVMVLLATAIGLAVPNLSRSFRQRTLNEEARQFYSLTEYARDEAMSQGIPMVIWLDPASGEYGIEPKTGYTEMGNRQKSYRLHPDVSFDRSLSKDEKGHLVGVEFSPGGHLEETSLDSIILVDRYGSSLSVVKTLDGLGYQISKT